MVKTKNSATEDMSSITTEEINRLSLFVVRTLVRFVFVVRPLVTIVFVVHTLVRSVVVVRNLVRFIFCSVILWKAQHKVCIRSGNDCVSEISGTTSCLVGLAPSFVPHQIYLASSV